MALIHVVMHGKVCVAFAVGVSDFFHHHRMECGEVSPGTLVAGGHLLVDRRKECAGSTGEVADAETADGPGVGPVNPFQLGHGQPRQQGGGLGAGVEGGEVFAVCDEPLEDTPTPPTTTSTGPRALRNYPADTAEAGNAHPTSTTHTLTGLEYGTEYNIRGRALYTDGENADSPWNGPWTETTAQVTLLSPSLSVQPVRGL